MIYRTVCFPDGHAPAIWASNGDFHPIIKINGIDTIVGPNGELESEPDLGFPNAIYSTEFVDSSGERI
ncbi:hypothetical protein [Rosenbergiella epipactidis]|uniref:hypothetical protein n=1 Tax=Rosenbergiella epipactidis TaxID=1544694 RepID=UPI001F4EA323|nr:hypothetical protein [Rosenbergiella epipactidis]